MWRGKAYVLGTIQRTGAADKTSSEALRYAVRGQQENSCCISTSLRRALLMQQSFMSFHGYDKAADVSEMIHESARAIEDEQSVAENY